MPYADKDRQREFQRKWASLNKHTITYKELIDCSHVRKIKAWNTCVERAKETILTRRTNRLMVAELALRACFIRRGGRLTDTQRRLTLKAFADDIGVHHKTLGEWIAVKTIIIDKLPQTATHFDWTAAQNAIRYGGRYHKDINMMYQRFTTTQGARQMRMISYVGYLRTFAHYIRDHGKRDIPAPKLREARSYARDLTRLLR